MLNIEAVLEKIWESLHTGSWADASDGMRKLYSHASLLKVSCNIIKIFVINPYIPKH